MSFEDCDCGIMLYRDDKYIWRKTILPLNREIALRNLRTLIRLAAEQFEIPYEDFLKDLTEPPRSRRRR